MRGASTIDTGDHAPSEFAWLEDDHTFTLTLRAYVNAVARALGVGPESTTIDTTAPASAYIALDRRLPSFPDRDLALLWDERHGWSSAVETHSGEDLVIVAYLGAGAGLVPDPPVVARFATDRTRLRNPLCPPDLTGSRHQLTDLLGRYYRPAPLVSDGHGSATAPATVDGG